MQLQPLAELVTVGAFRFFLLKSLSLDVDQVASARGNENISNMGEYGAVTAHVFKL